MEQRKLGWGISPDVDPGGPLWGARAILHARDPFDVLIDILHDRQDMKDGTDDERLALCDWINTVGLKVIKEQIDKDGAGEYKEKIITLHLDGYTMLARPSGGYIYLGAWRADPATYPGMFPYAEIPENFDDFSWSGPAGHQIPQIGHEVDVNCNEMGLGTVLSYGSFSSGEGRPRAFILCVKLHDPPEWFTRQNGDVPAHVFGCDLRK